MMFVTKANSRSTVHRPGYIDYIGVKRYKDGVVIGEHRFVGLFTSAAYTVRVAEVPLIRGKVKQSQRARALRPAAIWQGDDARARDLSARRVVSDHGRRVVRNRNGIVQSGRTPALSPVHSARSVRALRVVPDLRAARKLHDRAAAALSNRY